MSELDKVVIKEHLIKSESLFNNIHVCNQCFDIVPEKAHYGVYIEYQDILELREEFLDELYDSIVDWVYSSKKYEELRAKAISKGKTAAAANSEVQRKARDKFRGNSASQNVLIQGQLGELLLFHFIQRFQEGLPLLRKMKIATSNKHERFGADAIHFKYEEEKPIIILGESKTYTSQYKFASAFEDAIESILATYREHRKEIRSYVHEDFLDEDMNVIAERYLDNTLDNVEVRLVSIVVYNETKKLKATSENEIRNQIETIIKKRYADFDNSKINIDEYAILNRITYVVFPIWKLDELASQFQKKI